ncbi:MAG: nucleotide sugar dehydrogenase [Flavobacteriales bacterium TMED235]|nr:MAG: nucleotide sugar dehydrogenase [Flavobacteriales bacterium TMED235]|tara:strand:+ start:650 stop:2068 length:1419 start_codon:yes stop_codon:yes gene_type:complete
MKINKICCIGAGYVGGPTMAVIALKCPDIKVIVVDNNSQKIDLWNDKSLDNLPIFEPGLKEIISQTRGKNLFFSKNIDSAIDESQMIFMAVNTPTKQSGEGKGFAADLTFVESCARNIARVSKTNKIVVEKSTLPVRTAEKIKNVLNGNNSSVKFEVISNPEFLAEGTAIQDLFKSDRVLIGGDNTNSGKMAVNSLVKIYEKWIPKNKILTTNVWSSELSKLASNAMLAQRISSINSLSALCESTGADINEVSLAIGMDSRIGKKFLNPSAGFGGSCFKKDILNLVYLSKFYGLDEVAEYWHQVIKINDYQKDRFAEIIIQALDNNIKNKKISILGWAFKKDTNDSRESSAIAVSGKLIDFGANIHVYDPQVGSKRIVSDLIEFWKNNGESESNINFKIKNIIVDNSYKDSIKDSYAIAIMTEWEVFKRYDWKKIQNEMQNKPLIFDSRNIINKKMIDKDKGVFYQLGTSQK